MANNKKTLTDLLASLSVAHTPHVLIGGLVTGIYGKPRATVDVDMLVPERAADEVEAEMLRRGYTVKRGEDMMRFYRGRSKTSVADLVWREANPVLLAAFTHTVEGTVLGHHVTVVARGAFVALKYHAAVSPTRQYEDKHQDVSDILRVVAKGFSPEDEALAIAVAGKSYTGAGRDLAELLDDIRHKRPVRV